jgi:hypothetical protein
MKLSREQLVQLGDTLQGTCMLVQAGLERIGLDPDDYQVDELEDQLLDINMECCQGCGWWDESSALADLDNEQAGYCADCRESEPKE